MFQSLRVVIKELYHSTFLGQTSVHLTVIADPNAVSLWLLYISVGKSDEKQKGSSKGLSSSSSVSRVRKTNSPGDKGAEKGKEH